MKKNILIVGCGDIGRAIYNSINGKKDFSCFGWDSLEQRTINNEPLNNLVAKADIIFLCVPSQVISQLLKDLKTVIKKDALLIALTKGINQKGQTIAQVMASEIKNQNNLAVFAGPMLAKEIEKGLPAFAVFACKDKKHYPTIKQLFKNSSIHTCYSSDFFGSSLLGIAKNFYALLLGVGHGLNLNSNAIGLLTNIAINEMHQLLKVYGYSQNSIYNPAGISDLIATAFSSTSKNRQAGESIALTGLPAIMSEGYVSLPIFLKYLGSKKNNFPLLLLTNKIILQKKADTKIFNDFFKKYHLN